MRFGVFVVARSSPCAATESVSPSRFDRKIKDDQNESNRSRRRRIAFPLSQMAQLPAARRRCCCLLSSRIVFVRRGGCDASLFSSSSSSSRDPRFIAVRNAQQRRNPLGVDVSVSLRSGEGKKKVIETARAAGGSIDLDAIPRSFAGCFRLGSAANRNRSVGRFEKGDRSISISISIRRSSSISRD